LIVQMLALKWQRVDIALQTELGVSLHLIGNFSYTVAVPATYSSVDCGLLGCDIP
jgi:hypothetical protein